MANLAKLENSVYLNARAKRRCNTCTIVVYNAGHSECGSNLVSDEGTATTQFSTDVENKNDVDDAKTKIPAGTFIPQHALPWGGKPTNKIAAKWKHRMKERAKRRELGEANNPRYKTRGNIWKKMVAGGKLQQSANASMMFNTRRRLVHLVKYALSDLGASSHFLTKRSPAVTIKVAEYPIAIKLPDGGIIWSTYTCNLDIP